jgi:hypothetical protein
MKKRMAGWTTAIMILILLAPMRAALAHHAVERIYDTRELVRISGTVAKVAFTNPHVVVHIDAKDKDGKVTRWTVELSGADALRNVLNIDMNAFREGLGGGFLKPGDPVEAEVFAAWDGSPKSINVSMILPNGQITHSGYGCGGSKAAGC